MGSSIRSARVILRLSSVSASVRLPKRMLSTPKLPKMSVTAGISPIRSAAQLSSFRRKRPTGSNKQIVSGYRKAPLPLGQKDISSVAERMNSRSTTRTWWCKSTNGIKPSGPAVASREALLPHDIAMDCGDAFIFSSNARKEGAICLAPKICRRESGLWFSAAAPQSGRANGAGHPSQSRGERE